MAFGPSGGPKVDTGHVAIEGITLLLADAELAARVDVPALTELIESVHRTMERLAEEHPVTAPAPFVVQLTLAPDAQPRVKVAWQGAEPATLPELLRDALEALTPVAVRGEVPFQIRMKVHPHRLAS